MLPFVLQMVAIMAIFYFILIVPQRRQVKEHAKMTGLAARE